MVLNEKLGFYKVWKKKKSPKKFVESKRSYRKKQNDHYKVAIATVARKKILEWTSRVFM